MKENIYNLSNGKEKKKKFNIELGQSKTFPYPNIYFHPSEWQIYTFSIKRSLYQLLALETNYCTKS